MNIDIIFIITVISAWLVFLIIYKFISLSIKKKRKKIAFGLIQYINNYKNLLKLLETENVDTSSLGEFDLFEEFYDMIVNYCCEPIELESTDLLDEIEKYEYIFNFKLLKNADIDIEFIELSNVLLIDFVSNLLKLNIIKNDNLKKIFKELNL